jgi:hypothetical protein
VKVDAVVAVLSMTVVVTVTVDAERVPCSTMNSTPP